MLGLSIIKNKDEKIFKESIEILKIFDLIENV